MVTQYGSAIGDPVVHKCMLLSVGVVAGLMVKLCTELARPPTFVTCPAALTVIQVIAPNIFPALPIGAGVVVWLIVIAGPGVADKYGPVAATELTQLP